MTLSHLPLALLAVFLGCSSARHPDLPKTERLTIAHYKVPCTGEGRLLCMVATTADGAQTLLYDQIEGFTFEWGQRASVLVRIEEVANPMADASSQRMILQTLIKRTPDDSRFELLLEPEDLVSGPDGLTLLRDIRVTDAKHGGPGATPQVSHQQGEFRVTAWLENGVLRMQPKSP